MKQGKTFWYFFKTIGLPIIIIGSLWIIIFKFFWLEDYRDKQERVTSEVIQNTIKDFAEKDLLLPKTIIVTADSTADISLKDTLTTLVAKVLLENYLHEDVSTFQDIEIQPYFFFPENADSNGNYMLTQVQLNELKYHLEFLAKTIDLEVDAAKQEISNSIEKLNTWISVWIGILGFFGIFIPIFINYELRKDTEEAKEKAEIAHEALKKDLPEITKRIEEANLESNSAFQEATIAKKKSTTNEKLLNLFISVSDLRDLDVSTLKIVTDKRAFLVQKLKKLYSDFVQYQLDVQHVVITNSIRQLAYKLHYISLSGFSTFTMTEEFNNFTKYIFEFLESEINQDSFNEFVEKLKVLIETLENSEN